MRLAQEQRITKKYFSATFFDKDLFATTGCRHERCQAVPIRDIPVMHEIVSGIV